MCRYVMRSYRRSFVCMPCRHVAQYRFTDVARCPSCSDPMVLVGHDFHAPRKRDKAGWAAVALNIAAGRLFDSCGCNGPGYRPATPAQARQDAAMNRPKPARLRRRTAC